MCTVVIHKQAGAPYPLVVAANRDELLDRPSSPPQLYEGRVLRPHDLQRHGTWVGVNKEGIFAALTNRIDVKSVPHKLSRGMLVHNILHNCKSLVDVLAVIHSIKPEDYNGFHLVAGTADHLYLVWNDRHNISILTPPDGWLVVTNWGVGMQGKPAYGQARRVNNVCRLLENSNDTLEFLHQTLHIHDDWRHGTCINEPELNYGTKSSCVIRFNSTQKEWEYWHRERSDLKQHICLDPFGDKLTLKLEQ